MKFAVILVGFLLSIFFSREENRVRWVEGRTVTENDFKSKVDLSNDTDDAWGDVMTAASIAIDFKYEVKQIADDSLILDIYSFFTPEKSYMYKFFFKVFEEAYLPAMNHEQRHFDIAEIYSRKFKASIPNEISENYSKVLDSLYVIQYDSFCIITKRYDLETEHGTYDSIQITWNNEIDSILNEYSNYKNNRWAVAWSK